MKQQKSTVLASRAYPRSSTKNLQVCCMYQAWNGSTTSDSQRQRCLENACSQCDQPSHWGRLKTRQDKLYVPTYLFTYLVKDKNSLFSADASRSWDFLSGFGAVCRSNCQQVQCLLLLKQIVDCLYLPVFQYIAVVHFVQQFVQTTRFNVPPNTL